MSATATETKRKISVITVLSSIFILISILWATIAFIQIQGPNPRDYEPHKNYDDIEEWPYNILWEGGRSSWFEDVNYTDIPLDQSPPENILEQMENVVFFVTPELPAQLWRTGAYDIYDGSGWRKTYRDQTVPVTSEVIERSEAEAIGNQIYTVILNVTAGPNVGDITLPTLFPHILVIGDSFTTGSFESETYVPDQINRLIRVDLLTDPYGTLLLQPMIDAPTGEHVLISYEVTYVQQDLDGVQNDALEGSSAPSEIRNLYGQPALADVDLTQRVLDEIAPFENVGNNAFDKVIAVDTYFKANYELMINETMVFERPPSGQEVTDWFIERGGGLPIDFATAYCVFMRHMDIPARLVIGYAVGDAQNAYRIMRVRHMMFWVEVFVPMSDSPTDGEWIQVVPIPLPPEMGGAEIPENTETGDIQLWVWANLPEGYAIIGEPFDLSALLMVNYQPVTTQEIIVFRDITDNFLMGTALIEQGDVLPLANLTYTYEPGTTPGFHNVTATYHGANYDVVNWTAFSVFVTPDPLLTPAESTDSTFVPSEIVDINIKLGLDNYTALWEDTLHIHGVMTVGGEPVDGTTLTNDQMEIFWDNEVIGYATIQSDGTYSLDVFVDPTDPRMNTGPHEVWSYYSGDPVAGYLPARSAENSTVTIFGTISLELTVIPSSASPGSTLYYDGVAELLNGTILVNEDIGLFFNWSHVGTVQTNSSGGFSGIYNLPEELPTGLYDAVANWSSTIYRVLGNWSNIVQIEITVRGRVLTIDSNPKDPQIVHIGENITIFGSLTDQLNGSGLVGSYIDIWWQNGTDTQLIASVLTGVDGYYEFNYTVEPGYEGLVTYWSEFISSDPEYASARSENLTIQVQKWITEVSIEVDKNPVRLLEDITIYGVVSVPEMGNAPLGDAPVNIFWGNSTGPHLLATVWTSSDTGAYSYTYQVPFNHEFATFEVWAEFISPWPEYADSMSDSVFLQVKNYDTILTIFSNSTYYHLNETAHIWGHLTFENGSSIGGREVVLTWNNGSSFQYTLTTNSTGWFDFYYNLTLSDEVGTVIVMANFTSWTRLYANSSAVLSPSLTLQLYVINLDASLDATEYHLDETVIFSGTLTFDENGGGIGGETITIYYQDSSGTQTFVELTDANGFFQFTYPLSSGDPLGTIYVWADYSNTNPLWADAQSLNRTAEVILYRLNLTTLANSSLYYLNETVMISGRLSFLVNGSPVVGEEIVIYWDWGNGTIATFSNIFTDVTGNYLFYYNCSPDKDSVHTIDVWAEYSSTNLLWDDATSAPGVTIQFRLYETVINLVGPSNIFIDQTLTIQGILSYLGGTPAISDATINLYILEGTSWVYVDSAVSSSTGGFIFNYDFTIGVQPAGMYSFKCNYTSLDPLDADAQSAVFEVDVLRYDANLDISVVPTTAKLNQSITLYVHLFFSNGSAIQFEQVDFYWDNGTVYLLGSDTTNDTGQIEFIYDRFSNDLILSGILVYARFAGSDLFLSNESTQEALSLERWLTRIDDFSTDGETEFFILDYVDISGILYYDLSTPDVPFAYATIEILFNGDVVGTTMTGSDGSFSELWQIPDDTNPGTHELSVRFVSSVNWIEDCSSGIIELSILQIQVSISAVADSDSVYLGDTLTISGILTFANDTPMVDYEVQLVWNGIASTTAQTIAGGAFTIEYVVPWDATLGDVFFTVRFNAPSSVYADAETSEDIVQVRDLVLVLLDEQPFYSISRGESFVLTGSVINRNGPVANASITLIVNGTLTGLFERTDSNGEFSIDIQVDSSTTPAIYTLQVNTTGIYYDMDSPSEGWSIRVLIPSELTLSVISQLSVRPGEIFQISVRLVDDTDNAISGQITILLNGSLITAESLNSNVPVTLNITVPTNWLLGSGFYLVEVVYTGNDIFAADSDEATQLLHIFSEVVLERTTPTTLVQGNRFVISGFLRDELGSNIVGRTLEISIGTTTGQVTTGQDGSFEYVYMEEAVNGTYTYTITLLSPTGNLLVGSYTVTVQTNVGGLMQTLLELLIPSLALAGAAIVVILYLYFVKGRFRRPVRSSGVDIPTKLRNIKKLADAGKYGAAITLAYRTFEQMCSMKIGSERMKSETAREYLQRCLNTISLDSTTVEQFTETYEEARFSGREMSREKYEEAIRIFTDLYPRIDFGVMSE